MIWLVVGAAVLGAIVAVLYLTVRDGVVAPARERATTDEDDR